MTKHRASSHRTPIRTRRQRGAALILTVIVIMVLVTLGMAMVAFTTTEEKSASSYRDTLQTRSVAEAGVRIVQMMFSNPDDRALVPWYNSGAVAGAGWDYYGANPTDTETSLNAIGIYRHDRSVGISPAKYTGSTDRFFRGPFSANWATAFGGSYSPTAASDLYDLKFNCTNPTTGVAVASANCWLDSKINSLLSTSTDWNLDSGKITDISFYAPPVLAGRQYAITTVRVTAEKYSGTELLSREVIEAVIGDRSPTPAIMGNGDVNIKYNGCGDGCELLHANGNLTLINPSTFSGGNPPVSATGTITGGSGTASAPQVTPPAITPWDLKYKPTTTGGLANYYLVSARPLDAVWTDDNPSNNPAATTCGLSTCQDYNLEYDTAGTAKSARTAVGSAYLYRWDATNNEWNLVSSAVSPASTITDTSTGLSFTVTRGADIAVAAAVAATDNAVKPFNVNRVPTYTFNINTGLIGATILVDGIFNKAGSGDFVMSIIAAGSIHATSSTDFSPALENKVMLIAGRDFKSHSSFNSALHNVCNGGSPVTLSPSDAAHLGIIAVHEQMDTSSQTSLAGVVIAENSVHADPTVENGPVAIQADSGDHVSQCSGPDWPWARATKPAIFAMKSASN
jgi:hypothetical protein